MDFEKFSNVRINPNFIEWAKSLTGMEGGNLEAPLWLCGIEPGGKPDNYEENFTKNEDFYYQSNEGYSVPFCTNKIMEEHKSAPYYQKVAKVVSKYFLGEMRGSFLNELFTKNGKIFKMNLYPLTFQDSDDDKWRKEHFERTGFQNKPMYKVWCMIHRFPILKNLVERFKPKILICTGKKFRKDFLLAFSPDKLFDENIERQEVDNWECELFKLNGGNTFLIIAPFFGVGGIMSDKGLEELARLCQKLNPI